ncbi:hypothetical protein Emtol_2854 [Emticicia oligotrophica DSM 17448]|uniref:DUF4199 domain-containing protein n=1 Tax=Emticicia oligotrophica (strain DSM 17448 / CIP 109782 / MTCC 6937 / GPTSA100-15) TaxID=929562 RepID=A0ABN4ANN9_EMTOG|nr:MULTISPECIES: DUF4199 domain-containing protein [Emticicia]AFK03988.1 hypothetical protein Emtol_2854 [Emticicia oligotrophica DSM 17448]
MKKLILTNGLIAGVLISVFTVCSIAYCYASGNFEGNMVLGYAAMILSFSFVFVGVKKFRDEQNDGTLTFGKGFITGLYISLIASSIYVLTWLIDYYFFIPDFLEKFSQQSLTKMKGSGASTSEISAAIEQMEGYKKMYASPLGVIFLTYMEILPVGLVVSLISALILKRK